MITHPKKKVNGKVEHLKCKFSGFENGGSGQN